MEIAPNLPVQPGQILEGKYRIDRILGQGGMGVVVQATHLVLEERVAIKFLLPMVASNPELVERFVREAKAAIRIHSEHVVRVMDVSAANAAMPYLVMEFLQGKDLSQLLQQGGPLPPRDVVGYMLQTCEALGEAHAQGIVHRDLKPANLFLTSRADGSACVKVLDFGISKLGVGGETSSLTSTQGMMGSPLYMSPEQAKSARSTTARSDIWSLGVVMYELLTGATPFHGESLMELCVDLFQRQPPPPSSIRPNLPAGLDGVVMRCIAKDPAHRFQNIAELAAALAPFGVESAWESARVTARVLGVDPMVMPLPLPQPMPPLPPLQDQSPEQAQSRPQQVVAGAPGGNETVGSWGSTQHGKRRAKTAWFAAAALLTTLVVIAAGGAGLFWWQSNSASTVSSGASATDASSFAPDAREEVAEPEESSDEPLFVAVSSASSAVPVASSDLPSPSTTPAKTAAKPPRLPAKPPDTGKKPAGDGLDLFMDNK